jgi:hypothetical protein
LTQLLSSSNAHLIEPTMNLTNKTTKAELIEAYTQLQSDYDTAKEQTKALLVVLAITSVFSLLFWYEHNLFP